LRVGFTLPVLEKLIEEPSIEQVDLLATKLPG